MSQTHNASVKDVGLALVQPVNFQGFSPDGPVAFTDFFEWTTAAHEAREDVLDARATLELYDAAGVGAFVRLR